MKTANFLPKKYLVLVEVHTIHFTHLSLTNFIRSELMNTCLLLGFQKMVPLKTTQRHKRQHREETFSFSRNEPYQVFRKTPPLVHFQRLVG